MIQALVNEGPLPPLRPSAVRMARPCYDDIEQTNCSPYWGRSRKIGFASPLDSGLRGHVPRARSVNRRGTHLPERKERAPMPPEDTNGHINGHKADQRPRCEFGKSLFSEGECQRPGEVQSDGSLLCAPHDKLLRLEVRESTLLATVFELDKWLENPSNRAEELHWRRVLHERDEAVEQLRFNRTLIDTHKEVVQQR